MIYPYVKQQYEKGKFKEGRIYSAFKSRWYLSDAKEALLEEDRKANEKKQQIEAHKKYEENEQQAQSLYEKIRDVIEKHGGRNKALYKGHPIAAFNQGYISISVGKERQSFDLDKVKEADFSSPKGKKE